MTRRREGLGPARARAGGGRAGRAASARAGADRHAPAIELQRKAGNQAVTSLLDGGARGGMRVQRSFLDVAGDLLSSLGTAASSWWDDLTGGGGDGGAGRKGGGAGVREVDPPKDLMHFDYRDGTIDLRAPNKNWAK